MALQVNWHAHMYISSGEGTHYPVRVHRLTDRTEILSSSSGWFVAEKTNSAPLLEAAPAAEAPAAMPYPDTNSVQSDAPIK